MSKSIKIIITILGVVSTLALASTGWLLWQNNDLKSKNQGLENKLTALNQTSKTNNATKNNPNSEANKQTVTITLTDEQKQTIQDSMDTMNTQPLAGYMASQVEVVIAASEGTPPKNPDEATLSLDYFKNSKNPWDFNLSASVLSSYAKSPSYGKYFLENTYVGKAASGEIVSFHFGNDGKIDRIFMSVSESILNN